jgi:hypothetical protein
MSEQLISLEKVKTDEVQKKSENGWTDLGDDVRGVEQELEKLASRGGSRSLLEPRAQGGEGGGRPRAEGGDLVPQVGERGTHPRGGGVDALEARAEADEVGVVAVDEADELGAERGEVGTELGGEALEGHVGAKPGDVGVRVEVGAEEGVGLEPRRVRLDRLAEEVGGRGRHGDGGVTVDCGGGAGSETARAMDGARSSTSVCWCGTAVCCADLCCAREGRGLDARVVWLLEGTGDSRAAAFSFRRGPDTRMSFSWAMKVPGTNFELGREVYYVSYLII